MSQSIRQEGKKVPTLVLKVDYEKAYDSVKWSFFIYTLSRMNFDGKWIRWIKGCLKSSSVSVLVNGSPTDAFKMEQGLRQGDPLASFLFLIVAEWLNSLVMQEVMQNRLWSLNIGGENPIEVSLLQFVDDTLFAGETSIHNFMILKCIIHYFELVSELSFPISMPIYPYYHLQQPFTEAPASTFSSTPVMMHPLSLPSSFQSLTLI